MAFCRKAVPKEQQITKVLLARHNSVEEVLKPMLKILADENCGNM